MPIIDGRHLDQSTLAAPSGAADANLSSPKLQKQS